MKNVKKNNKYSYLAFLFLIFLALFLPIITEGFIAYTFAMWHKYSAITAKVLLNYLPQVAGWMTILFWIGWCIFNEDKKSETNEETDS